MKVKGFIFDLDGVIVDTAKYHFLAWKGVAEELNVPFTEVQNEQLKGVSRVKSLEKILNWGNLSISEDHFDSIMKIKNENYLSFISNMTEAEILPDVVRVLNFLKNNHQKVALGSASKNAQTILKKVGLHNYFEVIVDGNSVSKAKPDPEVFLIAAEGLGTAAGNCIVIEDSIAGIQAANAAGMISIGIGEISVLNEANYVFRDFTEITTQFLNKLIEQSSQ
jgi:beta-phosphoglucomutase